MRHCVSTQTECLGYGGGVPRVWNETLDAHRHEVRGAILTATSTLIERHGLRSLTMSKIAEDAGIGRATLYRYFGDVEAVVRAWHHAQITGHLEELAAVRDQAAPAERLAAVLQAYAVLSRRSHGHDADVKAVLHRDDQVEHARQKVRALVSELISEEAEGGTVRGDVPPHELASYCIHAVRAAGEAASDEAVRRLVAVTLAGLRPEREPAVPMKKPAASSRSGAGRR